MIVLKKWYLVENFYLYFYIIIPSSNKNRIMFYTIIFKVLLEYLIVYICQIVVLYILINVFVLIWVSKMSLFTFISIIILDKCHNVLS